jgi:hypothetical protein
MGDVYKTTTFDCLLFDVQRKYFYAYSGREQVKQTYKIIQE